MLCSLQYKREFGISMCVYFATVLASIGYLKAYPDTRFATLITVLPVVPAIMAAVAIIRELNRLDELQLRIQLNSLAVSFLLTAIATFTYGFLENIGYPPISMLWVLPFMLMVWGSATPLIARNYR